MDSKEEKILLAEKEKPFTVIHGDVNLGVKERAFLFCFPEPGGNRFSQIRQKRN